MPAGLFCTGRRDGRPPGFESDGRAAKCYQRRVVGQLGDARAYLQRRVALFTGVTAVFFAVMTVTDLLASAEGEALFSSTRIANILSTVSSAAIWLYCRRGERSIVVSRSLELAFMAVVMVAISILPLVPPVPGVGGVMAMFTPIPMAVMVCLRAAVIPSPTWLSVAVSAVWGLVMTACSTAGWEGVEILMVDDMLADQDMPGWALPLSLGLLATAAFSFITGVISKVVFGLQTSVRAAMELGQYTLEAKLGEGGMGVVYRAHHRMLRRPTAVKLLPPEKAGDAAIARFEREVRQTSRLSHPNTVAIFDFGRTQDGVFYYAMELLEGASLQTLVDRYGPLPAGRAVHILSRAAEALAEAHQKGLVHRDVKPDNIMLCERGGIPDVVKVLDFGLVKEVESAPDPRLSGVDTVRGTPLYMAPEALTNPDAVDGRSDLYALGAVGYFLLTGRSVFGGTMIEVLAHHLHSAPPPLGDDVDPALAAVIRKCLAKEPSARFGSANELVDALGELPAASTWGRAPAAAWWDAHRQEFEPKAAANTGPSALTVAVAETATADAQRSAN